MSINKKSCRLLLGLLSILFLAYFFHTTSFPIKQDHSPSSSEQKISVDTLPQLQTDNKNAFVTFLCDDVMVFKTKILEAFTLTLTLFIVYIIL